MKAFILANVENGKGKSGIGLISAGGKSKAREIRQALEFNVLNKINDLKEVEEAYLLFGEWDILIKVNGKNPEYLTNFVINKIRKIPEIKLTSTMIVAQS